MNIKLKGKEYRVPSKHIFCPYTPAPGVVSKVKKKLKVAMFHIKLKRMEHTAPCKHILCSCTHTRPLGLNQKVKTFLSESIHVAFQIKGNGA